MTEPVEVQPANIPDELKERDQWLLWDRSNDTPRQPHWNGDFAISWSDPDDWHSFDEAVELGQSVDSWGIGYVMAADNDDHARGIYGVIDLDGCAKGEFGSPKEWVPSLDVFAENDAYIEWSPSGEGLHIPVVGAEQPDWWTDEHFTDDEHEGVEFLTNKFCTFTGDTLNGCGGEIVSQADGVTSWLREAATSVTGDDPRDTSQQSFNGYADSEFDEDDVEDMLDHVNADCSYARWRDIGFALHDQFNGSATGRRLFEQWSRGGSKWDSDAEEYVERIWNDATTGGGRTIGTVVHLAKENGWSARTTPEEILNDGGATTERSDDTTATDGDDSDEQGDDDADAAGPWDRVANAYRAASDADERLPARFEATEQLVDEADWRTLFENDQLWRYDGDLGIFKPDGEARARERLVETLEEQYKANEHREICEQIRGRTMIREEQFGGPEKHIATENCVLEIAHDGITVHDHSPDYNFVGRCQTPYDADADCPRFRAFLRESVKGDRQVKTLQEYAGYALMHWRLPYHKALFLVGPTASGKSTFLDTIRAMLGQESVASLTPQQMTSERFGGAELYGKWANIRNDIPAAVIEDTGQFKEITAGDPIKAEEKYQDPFMFEPTAKHMFSANQLPEADTDDEAFFRRILLIAFPTTVPRGERDPSLDDKLQDELPGILNWCLDGLQRLMQQGRFTLDRTPGQTQDTWEKWGNSVSRFEKLCLEDDGSTELAKSEVYSAYVAFCESEGIPTETQRMLTRTLKLEGYEDGRAYVDGDRERVFHGVTFTGRGEELLEGDNSESSGGATGGGGGLDSY